VRAGVLALALLIPGPAAAQAGSPAGPVPVERLAARRAALLDSIGSGIAVLRSAEVRSIERDYPQESDYREDNDFFYLTGLEAPGGWLVLVARPGSHDRVILYLPQPDSARERWAGSRSVPGGEAARLSGIETVRAAAGAELEIQELIIESGSPARTGALYLRRGPRERDSPFFQRMLVTDRELGPPVRITDLSVKLAQLRLIKDADEVARLRRSIAITGDGLREAMQIAKPGIYEYELEARVEYAFRRAGAARLGFPSVIGSGPNSTTLHYDLNRRQTREGDLVVMDVGAEFGYQTADITRTIPVSGRFTPRQRALYDLVLGAQAAAIDSVRPGTDIQQLNRVARDYLRTHSDTLCGPAPCDRYFTHGLSHWLGMDVHDVGSYASVLAPGMVLTVEPGIYIPEEQLGIRVEDDVLVTASGREVLSSGIPRAAQDVEAVMRGGRGR
jgi:Xaa-Pro aminopeptidase